MTLYSNILGKGKPFVFLHGFLGMSDNWKTLGTKFSEMGCEVHLIDQRNHGRSFHSDEFNYDVMVEDLKNYVETHQLEDIILLGHSMGGKTAMLFAVEHPDSVQKLIVADISPRFYPIHHETILKGLASLDFDALKSRGEADDVLKNYITDFGTRQFLLKNLYWETKEKLGLRLNLEALTENVSEVGEALPMHSKFEKDTLFLRGDRSEYISLQDEAIIKTHFPQAKIETISNAGHWLHAENPTEFFEAVNGFIKD
ncbi:alpha/beta fold hydrolase [Subsaxibacter sp. CAU 1640]|uniref:alpha/beta fold hydrolase n=1 Tax=Subsaxibacter sp. CAU 1640 TaxID=2933271 RepID=UPI002006974C|nr:alpha/beta fold hydrolase [Subsaxibacter sp. CAU 1640]MCK7590394.1 alpha/beta fold hydrolase [Subsaxibacter sp. CAU 1640]